MWQDTRLEVGKVQTAVTANYRGFARHLREGGVSSFLRRDSPLADPDTLGHPPGYPALVALVSSVAGDTDAPVQFFQITCDALSAVVLFLLVAELLTFGAGAAAGALAALSPQFAWNSVLLLPDTLAVLPLLAAVYCVALATRRARDDKTRARLALLFAAGALVGLSCWLRANALLLAPLLAAVALLLSARGRGLRGALALLAGALVVVGALTVRNAFVFRRFIPVSLGAGQTLLEGIADYDSEGRFPVAQTDLGIMQEEATRHNRPDYAATLFGPDAAARDRERLARGLSVVKSDPAWFAGVMARRALSMLRLERARLVSPRPPVTHPLDDADARAPDLTLALDGDDRRPGELFSSAPFALSADTDYLLTVTSRVERGRVRVAVERDGGGASLSSTIAAAAEVASPAEQPVQTIRLAFPSGDTARARLVLRDEDPGPVASVGAAELRALGPSRRGWTRAPRLVVHALQRLFLTAVVLPLAAAGLLLLAARSRGRRALLLLLALPAYYMLVQSAVHTEYRYVLAVPHALFALAAFALARAASAALGRLRAR
jgi:hypothetical protein